MTSYQIVATVPTPEKMGEVLSMLADVEGVSLDFHKIEEVPPHKNRPSKKKSKGLTNADFIFELMKNGTTSSLSMREKFKETKRNPESVYSSLAELISKKKIKKVSQGIYALVPQKKEKAK